MREISSHQNNLNKGIWKRTLGKSISEATISLIGGGRVAKNVSKFLLSAGVKKIKVFDILDLSTDPDWRHESISICGFEECLSNSDIVSLHVPMNEENKNMISKKELLVMGKNSYLINVSRGGLINEKDLYEALNSNLIKGAALDVFATEPYEGKLLECKNLIATPHVASSTEYVRDQMERRACENLINLLDE